MKKIDINNLEVGKEYFINPLSDFETIPKGVYKVLNVESQMNPVPSPSRDCGNGIIEVLSVMVYSQFRYISLTNVFSKEGTYITERDEDFYRPQRYEFYELDSYERHAQFGHFKATEIAKKVKNKETSYTLEDTGNDVQSQCIILDVKYSSVRNCIYYIILDIHRCKVLTFREHNIIFPELEELSSKSIIELNKKEEME